MALCSGDSWLGTGIQRSEGAAPGAQHLNSWGRRVREGKGYLKGPPCCFPYKGHEGRQTPLTLQETKTCRETSR